MKMVPSSEILSHQDALSRVYAGRVNRRDGYVEVPTTAFVVKVDVNMAPLPAVALYVPVQDAEGFRLLKGADQPYSPLALSAYPAIWIREEDFVTIRGYAESLILNPKASSEPSEKRIETLRKSAMLIVEDLFENPTPENIKKSSKVVGSFVYLLMKEPKAYFHLSNLSSHDPYTLQHSVGTAVNSIILGRKIGISDEQELLELGLGGLLHDIGKVKVKKEIINKNGLLDELEWEEMRQHSSEGFNLVKDNNQLTDRTKRAVLEHHEDREGTGYPHGRKFEDVHVYSKIVALSDVFNALTTNRSYSKARSPFEAFQLMREKLIHKLDPELFRLMVKIHGGEVE
jgi:HD-GYP domain-containing protein (c-di-GMP phosphodiesterase class II)